MSFSASFKKHAATPGWFLVGGLVLVLLVFAVVRTISIINGDANADPFEVRYLQHPVIAGVHMFFSIAFVMLAPFQFVSKLRVQKPRLHRLLGRFLIVCALVSGLYGLLATAILPAFGGLPSTTASWFFGPIFLACALIGFWHAYCKRFRQHREWMIRTFALGLAVGTQRLVLLLLAVLGGNSFYDSFGVGLWIGFSLNLILAEIWINVSRSK